MSLVQEQVAEFRRIRRASHDREIRDRKIENIAFEGPLLSVIERMSVTGPVPPNVLLELPVNTIPRSPRCYLC